MEENEPGKYISVSDQIYDLLQRYLNIKELTHLWYAFVLKLALLLGIVRFV